MTIKMKVCKVHGMTTHKGICVCEKCAAENKVIAHSTSDNKQIDAIALLQRWCFYHKDHVGQLTHLLDDTEIYLERIAQQH